MIGTIRDVAAIGLMAFLFGVLPISQAAAAEFHTSSNHAVLDGVQVGEDFPVFQIGTFRCSSITYSGTQTTTTASKIILTPAYSGCSWFYGGVNIQVNGCQFVLETNGLTNSAGISCPGAPMEVAFSTICVVTIGSQTGLQAISYATQGIAPKRDVTVSLNLSGMKYTQDSKSFPGCSAGTFSNGTYKGAATITGTDTSGSQADFWFA